MELKALLLDLDGTLVDTAPDMVGTLNRLLERHQCPPVEFSAAGKLVSNGGRALIEFGFGERLADFDVGNELIEAFLADYAAHVCKHSKLYQGMTEVLHWCETNELVWGVITNKPLALARGVLAGLGLLERCKILLGGDSLPVKKPDPVPMLHACMVLDLAPSQCVYVGDHQRDIIAGKAAGMDTAAALWGYLEDVATPENWGATALVARPIGLLSFLQDRQSQSWATSST